MERSYTVTGKWCFPLVMLHRDQARPATEADRVLIERMSGDASDPEFGTRTAVSINLIMEAGAATASKPRGRWLPDLARWEDFGWAVSKDPDIEDILAWRAMGSEDAALRVSAMAKLVAAGLTGAEMAALGIGSSSN